MEKIVKGDIFIIPNAAEKIKSFDPVSSNWVREKLKKQLGIEIQPEEKLIQVWIKSPESDNWGDAYGGFQKTANVPFDEEDESRENKLMGYFTPFLPLRYLQNKKEGDTIELTSPAYGGVKIELTCKQIGNRYERFGRFEEALEFVL